MHPAAAAAAAAAAPATIASLANAPAQARMYGLYSARVFNISEYTAADACARPR